MDNNLNTNCSHYLKTMTSPSHHADELRDGQAGTLVDHPLRIKSRDLLQHQREIEIDHEGRIYRLRLTQLNKLILTA